MNATHSTHSEQTGFPRVGEKALASSGQGGQCEASHRIRLSIQPLHGKSFSHSGKANASVHIRMSPKDFLPSTRSSSPS